MRLKTLLPIFLFTAFYAYAQIPTYYNDVNLNLTGTALRDELSTKVINTHTTILSYGWTGVQQTDVDPTNSSNVFLIYGSDDGDGNYVTDRTRSVNSNGGTAGTDWNREHTYPQALGSPNLGTSGPGADVHHLRACDVTMNSNRGSLLFIDGSGVAAVNGSGWYPGDEWKGDVARMMMYMYIRYGSQCYPSGVATGTTNSVDANMIDVLLEWNSEDPVSDYETQRNTVLESLQGNRNPFIDNPAFATTIWGGPQAEDKFSSASNCSELFISEYIEGSGNNKYLEIYNPTGSSVDLSTYDLVIYQNGSATVSATLALSGTIASNSTFVIENSSEGLGYTADLSTSNTVMTFNGDDAIALRNSSTIVDVIGQANGTDPGSEWAGCTLGTANVVMRRNTSVQVGDTDETDTFDPGTEWTCSATDDTSDLGTYTNSCFAAEVDVQGNSVSIPSGTTATSSTNDTDFGSTDTTSGTVAKTFTILNTGNSTLNITGSSPLIAISGTHASDFSLTSDASSTVAASSSTTFTITFDPSADGTREASISFTNDDSDESTYTFNISGTGTSGASGCDELFFSEYVEGSGNNKYLEIYNPSDSSIDLSSYDIALYQNGSATPTATLTLSGSIASKDVFVIENSSESLSVAADLSNGTVMVFNGDDAIALRKSSVAVDVIGQIGTDPGSQWSGTTCSGGTSNNTLIRNSTIGQGDTDGSDAFDPDTEWTCTSNDDVSNLGSHTSDCSSVGPEIDVQGNGVSIADGTTATSTTNDTDFGTVGTTAGSLVKTFTILNTGTSDLTLTGNPSVSGTNAGDFTITANPTSPVLSSGSTTFSVTFNPSADGAREATITIISDDSDEGTYTFNLSGTGASSAVNCQTTAGATLFQQDFESSPATPELTYTATSATISTGNGNTPAAPLYSGGSQGIQVSNTTGTVEFATINSSGFTNAEFSVRLASFSGNGTNGHEASDYVTISISTDGGSSYSEELTVTGSSANNSRWSFTSGTGEASVAYDGDNTTTTFAPSTGGDVTTEGYSTLKITGLPNSSTLRIKVEMRNSGTNEIWVIDDAIITGDSTSTTTWNGSWDNNAPNNTTKVMIEGNYDMTSNNEINTCECEVANGATLTITSSKYVKVENNIINNGMIVIEDDGSLLQVSSTGNISGSGTFMVRRNTTSLPSEHVYTYWSSPLVSSTLAEVVSNADNYYSFNAATQGWSVESSSSSMTPGVGYISDGPTDAAYPMEHTAEFTGSTFNNGNVVVGLSYSDDADSENDWNLLGNPYPSAIDAGAFLDANPSIGGTLYFWTHNSDASYTNNYSQNDYVSWNSTGGTANCGGCIAPDGNITSGQGFFAQALSTGDATFTNDIRISGNNTNFYRTVSQEKDRIWLNVTGENSFSQLLVGFLPEATDGVDRLYDGIRLSGSARVNFYSIIEDKPYSIQGKPSLTDYEEVPLGLTSQVGGTFTISIENIEGLLISSGVMLQDNLTNTMIDLKEGDYTFTLDNAGTYEERFVLIIQTSSDVLDVDDFTINNLKIFSYTNELEVRAANEDIIEKVTIYDILGKQLIMKEENSSSVRLTSPALKNNTFLIVKTELSTGKVLINKIIK